MQTAQDLVRSQGLLPTESKEEGALAAQSEEVGYLTALAAYCASVDAAGLVLMTPPSQPPSYVVLSQARLDFFAVARSKLIDDDQDSDNHNQLTEPTRVFGEPYFETVTEVVLKVHELFYPAELPPERRKARSSKKKKKKVTPPSPIDEDVLFENLLSLTFWLSEYDVWLQVPDRDWVSQILTLLSQMWCRVGSSYQSEKLDDFSQEGVTAMLSILQAKAHAVQLDFDLAYVR